VVRAAGWNLAAMQDLALAVKGWWDALYKQYVTNAISLVQIQIRQLNPLLPLAYDLPVTPPIVGILAGTEEAANVTATMSERTGLAGKAYRGRMYIAGVAENYVNANDTISSVFLAGMALIIGALINNDLPAGQVLAIFHRPGLVPKPLDNQYTLVNSYVTENILDSQRRRLPGRGR